MGDFLEIFYKLTEIPMWSVTPNIQHMLLKKYDAPEGGFPTVLFNKNISWPSPPPPHFQVGQESHRRMLYINDMKEI